MMTEKSPGGRGLSVVFLPPNAWSVPANSETAPPAAEADSALDHLRRLGVRWRVINPTRRPWNPLDRGNPFLRGIDPLRALRVLMRHRDADVIVSVFESNALLILLLRRLFFFRPKVILWDASVGNPWRTLRRIQRLVFPRYDGFMMLTSAQEAYLKEHYKLHGPVTRIGYNVDEAFYRPSGDGTAGGVLAVGDDISRDYPTLLKAAAISGSKFLIKSKWRPEHGAAAPANVTFLSERLNREAFRALYAQASIVVLPLHPVAHAGGITALFEAMAMAKPLIVTASGIATDFATDGISALVVPPGDPAALAAAVARLERDEPLRRTLGLNARQQIEGALSTPALARRMHGFIAELCKERTVRIGGGNTSEQSDSAS
jgi:glycosyltransferase involved in cell wall biosynthesis